MLLFTKDISLYYRQGDPPRNLLGILNDGTPEIYVSAIVYLNLIADIDVNIKLNNVHA